MKANELMIGNWVFVEDRTIEVLDICQDGINHWFGDPMSTQGLVFGYNELKPIPLTEEWLVKFGFENDGIFLGEGFTLKSRFGGGYAIHIDPLNRYLTICKYVHQLQNLYFALKGEELTIKTQE